MKRIRGFVFLVNCGSEELMFGRKVRPEDSDLRLSSNFQTSGLTSFPNREQARRAMDEFVRGRMGGDDEYYDASLARIEMQIAETDEELHTLRKKRSLIVVCYHEYGVRLRGRWVEGCVRSAVPGADLVENGFATFGRFDDAYYAASEYHRQSDKLPTTLATFRLKRL